MDIIYIFNVCHSEILNPYKLSSIFHLNEIIYEKKKKVKKERVRKKAFEFTINEDVD